LGDASIIRAQTSGIRVLRSADHVRVAPVPMLAITVQLTGKGEYEQHAVHRSVGPGDLHVMDLNAPYEFKWSGDAARTCLQIPLDRIGVPVDTLRRAAPRVHQSPHYRLVADHITQLTAHADTLSADRAVALSGCASIELVRGLLLSAAEPEADSATIPTDILLSEIRAYVRRHLADPELGAEQIARAHHISLRQLYKICALAGSGLEP
jgi:hypothetical protein